MTDFKKAMFEKRIEKLDELKPVSITWKGQSVQIDNFEKINQLMSQAVEDDLKNVQENLSIFVKICCKSQADCVKYTL